MIINSQADFIKLAIKSYDNPTLVSIKDFEEDLRRFNLLNTALTRFKQDKNTERLKVSINYIVTMSNCFGINNTISMIRFKITAENLEIAENMLYFLKLIPSAEKLNFSFLQILEEL